MAYIFKTQCRINVAAALATSLMLIFTPAHAAENLAALKQKALAGDYQAQRNLAFGYRIGSPIKRRIRYWHAHGGWSS